ncbi:MAG: hypothetical protein ACKV2V_30660 [Blastocatellia bacterium]
MKTHLFICGLLLSAILCLAAAAADKASFHGQWIMTKAEGIPEGMQQRMKVEQEGDDVRIETDLYQGDEVRTVPDHYLLDGREIEFPVKLQTGEETKGKRVARWNAAGNGFAVRDVSVFETKDGKVTITMLRQWLLAADGKSLVIEIHRTAPQGETQTKRTFNRK